MFYQLVNPSANLYRITLKLYIDCENGNPSAIASDATALIGMYDAVHHGYKSYFTMNRTGPKRIDKVNYNCVVKPSGVCVDEYTYTLLKTIDPGVNGIILGFQRCCRNNTINNIYSPQSTGITIWTKIPPRTKMNSSAKFNELPPNYVCVNAPLSVDHSATDADGDSLVYSLFRPYSGGTDNEPKPTPSNATRPPFNQIFWKNPYQTNNQMGGSPGLSINPTTGELTVTPTQKGQFVIGIMVQEYRNGSIIGQTRRDYQFNVIDCEFDIIANYTVVDGTAVNGAYTFECRDTVFFKNTSTSKQTPSYFWNFGDPTTDADTSHEKDPYWVYPGNGDYTVTLTVTSSICKDDYKYSVRIRSEIPFDLGPDEVFCEDFTKILDTRTADAVSTTWNTGQTGHRISVSDTGTYIADVSYGNCAYQDTITLYLDPLPEFQLPTDSLFCGDVDVLLDVGVPGLSYTWSTGTKDNSQTLQVNDTGTYWVTVRNLHCTKRDTTRIWQASAPEIRDTLYCGNFSHPVDAGYFEEGQYQWSNGANTQQTSYDYRGTHWIRVQQRHCINSDTFSISNPTISFDLGGDDHFCDEVSKTLDAGDDGIIYLWNTGDTTPLILVSNPGIYSVYVEDKYGCSKEDSVNISLSISPIFSIGSDTSICINSPTDIVAPAIYEQYEWNTGSVESSITITDEGGYKVMVTDQHGCTGQDSIYVTVDPTALPNILYVPNAFSPNGDNLNDLFPYSEEIIQPGYYILIFTRWGEKVFDSRVSELPNWDGTYKGERVNQQAFIYYMFYKGCDGFQRSKKGTVNPFY
jgi:gliding motility-associated-like protein